MDCSIVQKDSSATILLTNHTTPGHSIETEQLEVRLDNAREPLAVYARRIDYDHANPKRLWVEMGQPEYLRQKDVERLHDASLLLKERQSVNYKEGSVFVKTSVPPHAVAAITIDFAPEEVSVSR